MTWTISPGGRYAPRVMRVVFPAVLLLPALASAVDVQGVLPAGDSVWRRDLSPYVLTGDVTVPWGAKLTVEPGVQVIAVPEDALRSGVDAQRVELIVDGTLLVRGTASQPVEFTSHGNPGSWYGVRVRGGRGTIIDGARIDQASQGILLGMSATVRNSAVSALAPQCIQATFGTASLQNNDTRGCGGQAAPVEPRAPLVQTPSPRFLEPSATPPQTLEPSVRLPVPRTPESSVRLPAPRTLEPSPRPRLPETSLPETTVRRVPLPSAPLSPPASSRPAPAEPGDCALEPQVQEPAECPGIRQWRKNQERQGNPSPNASTTARLPLTPDTRPSLP